MKNLNSALAPKSILKGISMLMLVCFATLGIAYFVSNPNGGSTSQIPSVTTANYKVVDDIGGRSYPPPVSKVNNDLGVNRPPVEMFAFCLNSVKDIGGRSTTGELNTISNFEIGGTRSIDAIAFYLNEVSDIGGGGKSSDGGLLDLALIDLPIGGGKSTTGEIAFYLNGATDIGGKSSNGGLLKLALIDLPIGGGKLPPGEFKLST
jgi:hypothetical protein